DNSYGGAYRNGLACGAGPAPNTSYCPSSNTCGSPPASVASSYPTSAPFACGPCPCSNFAALPLGPPSAPGCQAELLVKRHDAVGGADLVGVWDTGPDVAGNANYRYWLSSFWNTALFTSTDGPGIPRGGMTNAGIDLSDAVVDFMGYTGY